MPFLAVTLAAALLVAAPGGGILYQNDDYGRTTSTV